MLLTVPAAHLEVPHRRRIRWCRSGWPIHARPTARGRRRSAAAHLVKPFALDELHARVRALLRRATDDDEHEILRYADLELDLTSLCPRRGERVLDLTKTEQRLLEILLRNPDRVLPRGVLYERVWGHDISMSSSALDVYVGYLRRKLEQDGGPRLVQTVRGVGFMLARR